MRRRKKEKDRTADRETVERQARRRRSMHGERLTVLRAKDRWRWTEAVVWDRVTGLDLPRLTRARPRPCRRGRAMRRRSGLARTWPRACPGCSRPWKRPSSKSANQTRHFVCKMPRTSWRPSLASGRTRDVLADTRRGGAAECARAAATITSCDGARRGTWSPPPTRSSASSACSRRCTARTCPSRPSTACAKTRA